MKLQSGQQVDEYTVRQGLGHGGMSDVFLAHDPQHAREVVLKFPHDDMMGDPKTYEHFCREVKIGQLLDHPNIQKLYRLGGGPRTPFLVLEYVPGHTLRELLYAREGKPHSPKDAEFAVNVGSQIARALAYAHDNHIAHRDLKPENIIVTDKGVAKVMDFGIAFVEGARRVTWGPLSSQVGTPDYMAPEQIKGVRGDHRTDIYALGMILYEAIAGRLPYEGDNALAIMNQHVNVKAPPLHQFVRNVSPAIEEVIMKAIRRDPNERWQTMQAFGEALTHPDGIDVAALREEREREAGETPAARGLVAELGLPIWQVVLLVVGILILIIALGVIAQTLRGHTG